MEKRTMAKDGSIFGPSSYNRNGTFTVGGKGSEKRFSDYELALDYLKKMRCR